MQIPLESSISFQLNANKNVLQVQLMHLIYDFPSPGVILFKRGTREGKKPCCNCFQVIQKLKARGSIVDLAPCVGLMLSLYSSIYDRISQLTTSYRKIHGIAAKDDSEKTLIFLNHSLR